MRHGGNLRAYAALAGCAPEDIVDFSASINPLGPPEWLRQCIDRHVEALAHYPDPDCAELVGAACARYGVTASEVACANGASELLAVLPALSGCSRAIIPQPAYGEYAHACHMAGMSVESLALRPEDGFAMDWAALEAAMAAGTPPLVILGQPNNPTGAVFDAARVRELACRHPAAKVVADEAFADFCPGLDRLTADRPANVVVVASLTKTFAIPGLRLGLALAAPELAAGLRGRLPPWTVNTLAQAVGARALRDASYLEGSAAAVAQWRRELHAALAVLPGLTVFPGAANFLLCRLDNGRSANELLTATLARRIAVRPCAGFQGLDARYFRVAVRGPQDNERLADAIAAFLGLPAARRKRPTPAIMVQGTASNAGKSLLAAALCRIFQQDGLHPAPFKAQNMSLNSAVTPDGREIGRAQATQAAACRREPDARMNPVLLKPSADKGSQVVVMGLPLANMTVGQYIAAKPRIWETVRHAYDDLASTAGIMVLEGAGSPAEVNLKAHDIVNMRMAVHAHAAVLLVADIDRGGAYGGLLGTMACLTETERRLVGGYVLNKFRGDESLLAPANTWIEGATGRPVLGVIPYLRDLGLPEEDSVSFRAGEAQAWRSKADGQGRAELDIAVLDLPHIANFTDFDALAAEADVAVRRVRRPEELGSPDLLILPGSKNTPADLAFLRASGLAAAVMALAGATCMLGVCGGYQMLGVEFLDPLGLEAGEGSRHEGLGLLPVSTVLEARKTLARTRGRHSGSGLTVDGYEIHHGATTCTAADDVTPFLEDAQGRPLGWGDPARNVWGTYLHGLFDADAFRRRFLDGLRAARGLQPLGRPTAAFDIHAALDRLADAVRAGMDMPGVYKLLNC